MPLHPAARRTPRRIRRTPPHPPYPPYPGTASVVGADAEPDGQDQAAYPDADAQGSRRKPADQRGPDPAAEQETRRKRRGGGPPDRPEQREAYGGGGVRHPG